MQLSAAFNAAWLRRREPTMFDEVKTMSKLTLMTLAAVGMLGLMQPSAKADELNRQIKFTFSGPVEIPGQVLSAGTYAFQRADMMDPNVIEVFNGAGTHLYGIFLTTPDLRGKLSDKPVLKFEERAAHSPEAIKAWFYPGSYTGWEFMYPARHVARSGHLIKRAGNADRSAADRVAMAVKKVSHKFL